MGGDVGAVAQLEAVAQVGLVGAEALHRLLPGEAREGARHGQVGAQRGGHVGEQLLEQREHILFLAERPLEVELGELGLPIGAQVFVAEAARDLEVALDASDHQQLLELLGRLGESVERAGLEAAGHDVVARAFGCGGDHDRRLDLEEAAPVHELADAPVEPVAQLERGQHLRAADVDVAVAHPHQLVDVDGVLVDGEGRRFGGVEHLDGFRQQLDLAGGQVGVDGGLAARGDLADDAQHEFVARFVGGGVGAIGFVAAVVRWAHDDLHDAVAVAQVEEDQPPVVAAAMHPAGQRDAPADMLAPQRSAAV